MLLTSTINIYHIYNMLNESGVITPSTTSSYPLILAESRFSMKLPKNCHRRRSLGTNDL